MASPPKYNATDAKSLIFQDATGAYTEATALNPFPVTNSGTAGSTVNITQVGSTAVAQGHGTAALALRVELPTDGTGVIGAITNTVTTTAAGRTTGGLTSSLQILASTAPAANIKASAGQLYHLSGYNLGSAPIVIHWYNSAGTPAIGAGTATWVSVIPANATLGGGFIEHIPEGIPFSAGIAYTATGAITNTDTTAITANIAAFNVGYV